MQRKEIVLRAIEFANPPRVPLSYCMRDDFQESDTAGVGCAAAADFTPTAPGATEWGYVWESLDHTMGQPGAHPLADEEKLAAYRPPDPRAPGRFAHLAAQIASNEERFIKFGLGIYRVQSSHLPAWLCPLSHGSLLRARPCPAHHGYRLFL